ncbi:MAG: hypothetical protein ABIP77_08035, partial [Candidatus Limnocylindrales bacterium]
MGHFAPEEHLPSITDRAVQGTTALDPTAVDEYVRLAAQGDEAAFGRLVSEHHAAMSRVAFVICGDVEATHDAVQSAWSIAWRRLG